MIGAIAGDIIGSIYEGRFIPRTDFPLFDEGCRFTDDTVLTCAVAEHLLDGTELVPLFKEYFRAYPHAGYGGSFLRWVDSDRVEAYNSFGNGSAMRVSPVGFRAQTLDEALTTAARTAVVTHNHPEGVKGAQAIATAIFLARSGHDKDEIRRYATERFGYDLGPSVADFRARGEFDVTCPGTVPPAIRAFLESESYEDAIRKAVSIGGDCDTIACMAGSIAEAYYGGVPGPIKARVFTILDDRLARIVRRFEASIARP